MVLPEEGEEVPVIAPDLEHVRPPGICMHLQEPEEVPGKPRSDPPLERGVVACIDLLVDPGKNLLAEGHGLVDLGAAPADPDLEGKEGDAVEHLHRDGLDIGGIGRVVEDRFKIL
jgi:hypothetical protein